MSRNKIIAMLMIGLGSMGSTCSEEDADLYIGEAAVTNSDLSAETSINNTNSQPDLSCAQDADALCDSFAKWNMRCFENSETYESHHAYCMEFMAEGDNLKCAFTDLAAPCLETADCNALNGDLWQYCTMNALIHLSPEGWDVAGIQTLIDNGYSGDDEWMTLFGGVSGKCLERFNECEASDRSQPFQDDFCITLPALSDAAIAQVLDCMKLDCFDISECIQNAGGFAY